MAKKTYAVEFKGIGGFGSMLMPDRINPRCPICGDECGNHPKSPILTVYAKPKPESERLELVFGVFHSCGAAGEPPITDLTSVF